MPEEKTMDIERIFAPTSEEIQESRDRIRKIIRRTAGRRHPFTREELEAILRSANRPVRRWRGEKESEGTSEAHGPDDST